MQLYNSFNELASSQTTSPLVSDMSVFNALSNADKKKVKTLIDDVLKKTGDCVRDLMKYSATSTGGNTNDDVVEIAMLLNEHMGSFYNEPAVKAALNK